MECSARSARKLTALMISSRRLYDEGLAVGKWERRKAIEGGREMRRDMEEGMGSYHGRIAEMLREELCVRSGGHALREVVAEGGRSEGG